MRNFSTKPDEDWESDPGVWTSSEEWCASRLSDLHIVLPIIMELHKSVKITYQPQLGLHWNENFDQFVDVLDLSR